MKTVSSGQTGYCGLPATKLFFLCAITVAMSSFSWRTSWQSASNASSNALAQRETAQVSIEYKVPDGSARKARLTGKVDVIHKNVPLLENAIEPLWLVTQPDGTEVTVDEILFLATDGTHRRLRFKSHYLSESLDGGGEAIVTFFEHAKIATEDWKEEPTVWFRHPTGGFYRVQVGRVKPPFPGPAPQFRVWK